MSTLALVQVIDATPLASSVARTSLSLAAGGTPHKEWGFTATMSEN